MAGKSSKTEVVTLRVPVALLAQWRREAESAGAAIGPFIVGRADAVPPLRKEIMRLAEVAQGMRKMIETRDAEIDKLTKQLKPVAALKLPVLTEAPKRETYLRGQAPEKGKTKTR